jgi:FSR family fosmidomycin resistance protein-like MFS transporter
MATNKRLLWVISYHHACNDGALLALVALLPILAEEMDLSYSEIGLLGFGLLITVVIQLLVGRLTDRMFSRYLLEVGAGLMAVSFLMVPFVSDFNGLFLAVISMRVGASFYHPVGISWITREDSGPYLDTALGIQSGTGNLGVIIALGTSGFLGEMFGWQTPCLIWAGMNLLGVALGLMFTGRPDRPTVERTPTVRTTTRSTMLKIGMLTVPIATGGALYQVTSYYGPLNLTAMHDWTAGSADLIFAVWIGIGTLTSYYFGSISARYGRQRILKVGYLVSALGMASLFAFSSWYLVMPVLIFYGAVLFVTYPALFAIVTDITDRSERGTAFGILFGFQLGGGAVVVYICGVVADMLDDPSYSFLIASGLSVVSLVTLVAWEAKTSPKASA